jgi:hypothetical protein
LGSALSGSLIFGAKVTGVSVRVSAQPVSMAHAIQQASRNKWREITVVVGADEQILFLMSHRIITMALRRQQKMRGWQLLPNRAF